MPILILANSDFLALSTTTDVRRQRATMWQMFITQVIISDGLVYLNVHYIVNSSVAKIKSDIPRLCQLASLRRQYCQTNCRTAGRSHRPENNIPICAQNSNIPIPIFQFQHSKIPVFQYVCTELICFFIGCSAIAEQCPLHSLL